jgi:hypothetical protein
MFIGEHGFVFVPHGGEPRVFPDSGAEAEANRILSGLDRVPGSNHFHQFVDACLGTDTTSTPFGYSGNLTETVLLGNIANRFQHERLEWDVANLSFPNRPGANQYLRRDYRDGWRIDGLG